MNISITFRHMASSEAIKSYAADKLGKLQKFLRQPMTAKVTLSVDGLDQTAEARISSGGEHLEAKETNEDMYASIDRMMGKLERQIRGAKGAAQAKRRGAESVRLPPVIGEEEADVAAPARSAKKTVKKAKATAKKATAKASVKKAR
ncbi:MAG TPA: ribosome-associated translation inhibitor RaiA [Polyangiaceae bacterium]|nr:ribosome-associated translation inhibitor RaiA [Polyangiaceae bacterium]